MTDDFDDLLGVPGHSHPLRHDPLLAGVAVMAMAALIGLAVLAVVTLGQASARAAAICSILNEPTLARSTDPGVLKARDAYRCGPPPAEPAPTPTAAPTVSVTVSLQSTAPAPSRTGSAARPGPAITPTPASRVGTRPALTPSPMATATTTPGPSPTPTPLLCVLRSIVQIGACP